MMRLYGRNCALTGTSLFNDHPRFGRRGGGTGLVYRNALGIKKVDAGERASFEFSEWIVTSPSLYNLRLVIIYRPELSIVMRH